MSSPPKPTATAAAPATNDSSNDVLALDALARSRSVASPVGAMHPLEPVNGDEIEAAVKVVREQAKPYGRPSFVNAKLVEASKGEVTAYEPGKPAPSRVVRILGTDDTPDGGFQADVDVTKGILVEMKRLPGQGQAAVSFRDMVSTTTIVQNSKEFQAAMEKRGLDPKKVECEPWPGGGYPHPDMPVGHRSFRGVFFYKEDDTDSCYARPIHGVVAYIDCTAGRLVALEDSGEAPLPAMAKFDAESNGPMRTDLKPIEVIQPEGPSFEIDGHHIKWAGWDFRVGMHPIHGLTLHQINFFGRQVLYRASLSDMVVPYGAKDKMHFWKHVLDGSEAGVMGGGFTNSLKLGCDCLGEIRYFDLHWLMPNGKKALLENAVCVHEEDAGIQWKKTDMRTGVSEVRRGRRLVVSTFSSVGNYDYGFYWHFHLDGEIEMEVKLTGILSVGGVPMDHDPTFAPLVAPDVAGPVHQHLFNIRLDWNLDGGSNSLYETNVETVPLSAENPDGTQMRVNSRLLETEDQAKRDIAPETSRSWKIVNRNKLNALGQPVGYKVLSGAAQRNLQHPNSQSAQRANFSTHNLWATPYAPDELDAAGGNTVMSGPFLGLPQYTKNNRSIVDCDLVTWHTIGLTHVPRPEDWPVMPVEKARLNLIPVGFFDKSPVMDLPTGNGHCHMHESKL